MSFRLSCVLVVLVAVALPLGAQEGPKGEEPAVKFNGIPADLMDDPHVRE